MSDHPAVSDGVAVRFLVVADMPMMVIGVGETPGDDALWTTLAMAGLTAVPGFYGVDFPRGAKVGFTVNSDYLRLEDEDSKGLLQVPRASVERAWLSAALRMRGTMLAVGRELDLDPDADDQSTCDELHTSAADERLRGAIVGVAEPRSILPLFF